MISQLTVFLENEKGRLAAACRTIADAGSVAFQFTRKGVIVVKAQGEDALLDILDTGAEDVKEIDEEGELVVYTDQKELFKVRQAILEKGYEVSSAELQYVGNNEIEIDEEAETKLMKILDVLDDLGDVTNVYTNAKG